MFRVEQETSTSGDRSAANRAVFQRQADCSMADIRGTQTHRYGASGLCVSRVRSVHGPTRHQQGVRPRPRSRGATAYRDRGAVQELGKSNEVRLAGKALTDATFRNTRDDGASEAAAYSAVPEMSQGSNAVCPKFRFWRAASGSMGSVFLPTMPHGIRIPATHADASRCRSARLEGVSGQPAWSRLSDRTPLCCGFDFPIGADSAVRLRPFVSSRPSRSGPLR